MTTLRDVMSSSVTTMEGSSSVADAAFAASVGFGPQTNRAGAFSVPDFPPPYRPLPLGDSLSKS